MGAALFYHLTRSTPSRLLPALLGKSLEAGWRVELRGTNLPLLEALDQSLWQGQGFLPHGLAGGEHDARQPVLLTLPGQAAANQPLCLILVGGAEAQVAECQAMQRSCILFDGNDPAAVEHARGQWRSLTAGGISAEYWSEADGRWQRKAAS